MQYNDGTGWDGMGGNGKDWWDGRGLGAGGGEFVSALMVVILVLLGFF